MALDEETRIGRLWRLGEENVEDMSGGKQDERAAVINGPAWSPDGKVKYICDTPEGKIYQYAFQSAFYSPF
ncbi:hypothetical protein ANO14919_051530 [Xylariales sp. No.14919]|nr:hypothetical protein ANO14919_051530 [Xylariales sp. No.14919]